MRTARHLKLRGRRPPDPVLRDDPEQRPPLRGVLVGIGTMGGHHLRVLRTLPGVDLRAVVDPDPGRRASAEANHAGLAAHATLAEALARHDLDFAGLAAPVEELPALAHEALAGGLHVLVEKPTAADEDAAEAMFRDAEARGLVLGVGHVERFNPAVIALKHKLEAGLVGRIVQMNARRLSPFPNREGRRGVAVDLATHDIDVMRFLTGAEVDRVFAETSRPLGSRGEDLVCATLRFDDDATGLLEVNWMTPTKVRQLDVIGDRGMCVVDYLTQDLCYYAHPTQPTEWEPFAGITGGGEGDMVRYALERREPLRVEWEAFLAAIRDGYGAPVDGRDGLAALSTALAIREAGERHEVVVPSYRARVHAGV
jgi:UDP-N-acetylglucosamine 3-dehydrogenase